MKVIKIANLEPILASNCIREKKNTLMIKQIAFYNNLDAATFSTKLITLIPVLKKET